MRPPIRLGWFVLSFNVVVILMGALVRATNSGAGCGSSWPTCDGELVPDLSGATAVEFTHRAASGVALILVGGLVYAVFRSTRAGHPARLGSVLSLIAIVGEALIGAMIVLAEWVADDASLARVIAVPLHLVNTLFLLAGLTLTIFWLAGGRRLSFATDRRTLRLVAVGGLALVLIAASGAVTALADTLFPSGAPTVGPTSESHFLTQLRVIHPVMAVVAALAGWWLAARADHDVSTARPLLPTLVAAMMLSGVLNVYLGVPIWMQLLHLLLADALWITYVWISAHALQESAARASRLSPSK